MKITICGSARFGTLWNEWHKKLATMGHIVYVLSGEATQESNLSESDKETFDLCHLAKIEESDAIVVLNFDGYVGDSTKREIKWARIRGKQVFWLISLNNPLKFSIDYNVRDLPRIGVS